MIDDDSSHSLREAPKLDYKLLHETGERRFKLADSVHQTSEEDDENVEIIDDRSLSDNVLKGDNSIRTVIEALPQTSFIMDQSMKLHASQESAGDEIVDFIDENLIETLILAEDIDAAVIRIEDIRTKYRSIHKNIKQLDAENYESTYQGAFNKTMLEVKHYIMMGKKKKQQIRIDTQNAECEQANQKIKSTTFLVDEVDRLCGDLLDDLIVIDEKDSDECIKERKEKIPSTQLRIDSVGEKLSKVHDVIPSDYPNKQRVLASLKKTYDTVIKRNSEFQREILKVIDERELYKTFQPSKLNIQLKKFGGYESNVDIYTFKSEFEKLHIQTTSKRLLPDLLKNNYLEGAALVLVKRLDDIDDIWCKLKKSYGDPRMMLMKKLAEVENMMPLWKIKDSERLKDNLNRIINMIDEIMKLAKNHKIEGKLYYGEGIYSIYRILGDTRVTKWLNTICDEELEGEEMWKRLVQFLEKEAKVQLEKSIINRSMRDKDYNPVKKYVKEGSGSGTKNDDMKDRKYNAHMTEKWKRKDQAICSFCGADDHIATNGPYGKRVIQYFACKTFVEMLPKQRYIELKKKSLCTQCLYPGACNTSGKHADGKCQDIFTCKHISHNGSNVKTHVLVCDEHKKDEANKKLLEEYRSRCITRSCNTDLPEFAKSINLSFLSQAYPSISMKADDTHSTDDDQVIVDSGIYMMQQIEVNDNIFTLFFDTGCSDLVCRYDAVRNLGHNSRQERKGPVLLGGVGGVDVESPYGAYQVSLPLHNGKRAVMSGLVIDQISSDFPMYPLNGKVQNDIQDAYKNEGGDLNDLPMLPEKVGGPVDFMVGIKYLRYHPTKVYSLLSGLTIYRSPFVNVDGSRGVVGGPHEVFSAINNYFFEGRPLQLEAYLSSQIQLYKSGYQINPDITFIDLKCAKDNLGRLMLDVEEGASKDCCEKSSCSCLLISRKQKIFDEVENAATEITYRCVKCRHCQSCRNGERVEMISIKEEVEQDVINRSVSVDVEKGVTIASLPFIDDPSSQLAPNKHKAMAIYSSQIKKLTKDPQSKNDVLQSERKLQSLGHVEYLKNLSLDQQKILIESPIQYYIPWRSVWNSNSLSTPCRVVFDASLPTTTGKSLNDILAKGRNNMNRLVEILICWFSRNVGFHTDVKKMYNSVKLRENDWCFQRYLWERDLIPNKDPEEKIIKTLLYGVKSSGNQSERGLRQTAMLQKNDYPRVNEIIQNDVYVDDCISGESTLDLAHQSADELELVLSRGGFTLKGFTFSRKPPPSDLSIDGQSINIAGMKWYPEDDLIQLDISELNFSKRCRGKKGSSAENKRIPKLLTRKQCVAKVAEIYDITGKITPITAAMKLDLHDLVKRRLQWDDQIPDDLRGVWTSHFEMMQEINSLKYHRAVVPDDAISLEVSTLDTADASQSMACVAIYTRFKRRNNDFSCQLVFARSKLIPEGTSQPRAELIAATLNAHTGEVVRRSFKGNHTKAFKFTDSQIVLYWIYNHYKSLKQWVRTRIIEINRFTETSQWFYVKSNQLIADLGTRRGAKLSDVNRESEWINGYEWMHKDEASFPVKGVADLKLTDSEVVSFKKEIFSPFQKEENLTEFEWPQSTNLCLLVNIPGTTTRRFVHEEVSSRYKFSQYLIDPNRTKFSTVVRAIAYVKKFIHNCRMRVVQKKRGDAPAAGKQLQKPKELDVLLLTDEEVAEGRNYFFRKATEEVKKFAPKKQYEKISKEKDGILYYTGRIMPGHVTSIIKMTDVMKDLSNSTFFVPIVEKHSPIAFSIVNQVHWYHKVAKHCGVETVLRYVMKLCFILEGRELVKMFRKSCECCRYLAKRTIDIEMGPVSQHNLTIAPAFYITQLDLAGPMMSYSPHNKRTTVKVWFVVYCCATTSTINIKVMEDYGTSAFLQSFIRFSCEVGYPKLLMSDEGSQLVKGYGDMRINFSDLKNRLNLDMCIEFQICPIGGHNMNGKVERKIKEIKESIRKSFDKERLSILQWETVGAEIANCINDLPLALGNIVSDFENMDLITPNRLRLGRNNERSPVGPLYVTQDSSKFLEENIKIFNSWFETWLISHVPKLMDHPKWFKTEYHLKKGDIVLFLKKEGLLNETYQYGMIKSTDVGRDGKIRSAVVKYRNHNENTDRETRRAVRQLIMIHGVDKLNILQELGEVAVIADIKKKLNDTECN